MKKGFPHKILGVPVGWKNLGYVSKKTKVVEGRTFEITKLHAFCKKRVRAGKENEQLFYFCNRCKVKLRD